MRHVKAEEQWQASHSSWSKKRTRGLDFINEEKRKTCRTNIQLCRTSGGAILLYHWHLDPLPPEPKLGDFYIPSQDQLNRDIVVAVLGMATNGFIAYKLL